MEKFEKVVLHLPLLGESPTLFSGMLCDDLPNRMGLLEQIGKVPLVAASRVPQVGNMNVSPSTQSPATLLSLSHRAVWEGGRQGRVLCAHLTEGSRLQRPGTHTAQKERWRGVKEPGRGTVAPSPRAPLGLTLIPAAQPLPGSFSHQSPWCEGGSERGTAML